MLRFGWKNNAGLVCISANVRGWEICVHLAVRTSHWMWGYSYDFCHVELNFFGLGPLALLVWTYWGTDDK